MNDGLLFILIILATGAGLFAIIYFSRKSTAKKKTSEILSNLPHQLPKVWAYVYAVPGKPFVQSTVAVPKEILEAVYGGIDKMLSTLPADYTVNRKPSDYNIAFIPPDNESEAGEPTLMVHGIKAAGYCVGIGGDGIFPPVAILPHQEKYGWRFVKYAEDVARFEGEHIAIQYNGRRQPNPDFHPIFLDAAGQ